MLISKPITVQAPGLRSAHLVATAPLWLFAIPMLLLMGPVTLGDVQPGDPAKTEKSSETVPPVVVVNAKVTQPDGRLKLSFSKEVRPESVKIDNVDAPIIAREPASIVVKVPANTPLGTQNITVTLPAGNAGPLTSEVVVAPGVSGLKANKDAKTELSRVVVAGGEVIVQFESNIPSEIRQMLEVTLVPADGAMDGKKQLAFSMPQNDYLLLEIPEGLDRETFVVQVRADGTLLEKQPRLRVEYVDTMYWRASLVLIVLILLIYLVYKLFYKVPEGQTRYSFVKMLLLEQENQTYSLSRAQFLGWLIVIIWSYLFLYYAHGFVEQDWSFPNLGNAVYAFLISLGTLLAAQATSLGQGPKGAGEVHPSLADLVVHGGVLALDRVQQVIWTLIALGMFMRITVATYATASALPEIPTELLGLMGLSSAGYLGGKLVRGAGPLIEQVTVSEGSLIINIKGRHLSKDAFVWLDGVQQSKDKVTVKADDPDSPSGFAKELALTLELTLADWYAKDHAITVINVDAQRADWRTGPEIIEVIPGQPDADGKVIVTINGVRLAKGAKVQVTGGAGEAVQDDQDANLFTVKVDAAWLLQPHELVVESNGKKSTYTYKPPAN